MNDYMNEVEKKLASYPSCAREKLSQLRRLILDVAKQTCGVGKLQQTLKWGELAYLTRESGSGTTIRIGWKAQTPDQYALYVSCNTTLIDSYRSLFPQLSYAGNRAIILDINAPIPEDEIRSCIGMALTYHLDKKATR